jgi:hypothetical protein
MKAIKRRLRNLEEEAGLEPEMEDDPASASTD